MSMQPSLGKDTTMDVLSFLPLELQILIFSHVPPQSLYILRRTCSAWNSMLSNPNLLTHIHANLPYLTSAPSLTTRLKRRQRMRHNNPVWAKPFTDVFPWVSDHRPVGGPPCTRFWNGWMVVLTPRPSILQSIAPRPRWMEQEKANITLKIGHITWPQTKTISVDVAHALGLQDDIVGLYDTPEEDVNLQKVTRIIPFHLHIQEGRILVGLKKIKFLEPLHPRQYTYEAPTPITIYFAIFELNGTLLSPISISPPVSQSELDMVVLTRLNTTHLLTLSHINTTLDPSTPSSPCSYRLNTYSLYSPTEVAPEVIIHTIPQWDHSGLGPASRVAHINAGMGFDNMGMIWFPRLPGFDLEFSCLEQRPVVGEEQSACVRRFRERDLPQSPCGGWVIFSGIEGLPKERTSLLPKNENSHAHPCMRKDNEMEILHEERPLAGPDSESVNCVNECKDVQLVTFGDSVAMGEAHNMAAHNGSVENGGTQIPATGTLLKLRKCKSHNVPQASTLHTTVFPHDLLSAQQTWILSKVYWNEAGESQIVTGASKCPFWGYLGSNSYQSSPDKACENLYLLPYIDDGKWEVVRNGLPSDFFRKLSLVPGEDWDGDNLGISVSMSWGDDGVVCWTASRMAGRTTIMAAWIVCYEEEWGLDSEASNEAE